MPENESLQTLEGFVETLLARESVVTPSRIREFIEQCRSMPMCHVSDSDAEVLARRFETRHSVTIEFGSVLRESDYQPWLEGELARIDPYYWSRYRRLLESKHLPPSVISTLHRETDRILGLLENPAREGPWGRRGMVVGHVQSGKTANYTGLICKAADAGYRLIVVIAGVHNNLRNQTQRRIDEGFVGRDSARLLAKREDRFVGVGRFDARRRPATFTNSLRDFSKEMATGSGIPLQNLSEPAVLVIKKNTKTLANLLEWLHEHNSAHRARTVDVPMLLIDDEADNASINVAYSKGTVSAINGQIRELLKMFSRSCYVGYTATPFANIFIDPETDDDMRGQDLFPRHFIVSLEAPSNYFGAARVFRDDADVVVRHVVDHEVALPVGHRREHVLDALPESMLTAARVFLVARAIRLLRGHRDAHCSMLINASRFTDVQGQVRDLVQRALEDIQASVRVNGALPPDRALRDVEIAALHAVWNHEYASAGFTWEEVQRTLLDAVAPVRVVEVNSRSHGTLAYDEYEGTGLSVIAVGGFSLSRGLTLEGLMVSYFLRNSKMYDTLMQMGRWFGYRPEYEDLCRVWMPEEAEGWYAHVSDATDELREELRLMAEANATPVEFGLKVRAHPTALEVTARNKMGTGERVVVRIGLKNRFIETTPLRRDSFEHNREVVRTLIADLAECGRTLDRALNMGGSLLMQAVPVEPIQNLLATFRNHPLSPLTEPGPVSRYIRERADGELAEWDILFAGVREAGAPSASSIGVPLRCQSRTAGTRSNANTLYITNKQRVASRGVERVGVPENDALEAEQQFREKEPPNSRGQWNYPDRIYRARRPRPLLIVHLLAVEELLAVGKQRVDSEPVVAWSISFPETNQEERPVEYVVTTTWMRENLLGESDDELEEVDV
jgi:hypothetical protein